MPLRQFTCLQCHKEFQSSSTHTIVRYCSKSCQALARRTEHRCVRCGAAFLSRHANPRYCSTACAKRTLEDRQCLQCGKTFRPANAKIKFCSLDCRDESYRRVQPRLCPQCNNSFTPWCQVRAKYCSKECANAAGRITKECVICGKTFTRQKVAGTEQQCCSRKCGWQWRRGRPVDRSSLVGRGWTIVKCEACDVEIRVHESVARGRAGRTGRRFCNNRCARAILGNPNPTIEKLTLVCKWCERVFQRHRSQHDTKHAGSGFCSMHCHGAYRMRLQNRVSKAETAFLDQLEAAGLSFERQVRIGHFIVDAFIPERNAVIEFDGTYWHSLPKIQAKDKRKAAAVESAGYALIRVRESDWMDDPEGTIRKVLRDVDDA